MGLAKQAPGHGQKILKFRLADDAAVRKTGPIEDYLVGRVDGSIHVRRQNGARDVVEHLAQRLKFFGVACRNRCGLSAFHGWYHFSRRRAG